MKHLTEEELIVYREGEWTGRESIARHLGECAECRAALERIEIVLAALDTMPVPDPGEDYGQRVWRQISARLPERRTWDWSAWFGPRRLAAAAVIAAGIVAAFLA